MADGWAGRGGTIHSLLHNMYYCITCLILIKLFLFGTIVCLDPLGICYKTSWPRPRSRSVSGV